MRTKNGLFILLIFLVAISACSKRSIGPAVLKAENFRHHVEKFNRMEDENKVNAIPNAQSWDWMKANIPLFDSPKDNFQEIYYYRWWTFRKHIHNTPQGFIITEFLVDRNYADKYNMISCALGHHIYEGRWLHNQQYINDYVNVWFRGNAGGRMKKLLTFSSWTADALFNRYKVNRDKAFVLNMLPDLQSEYQAWEKDRRTATGLFWQTDVKDGMEESLSGGRREQNARPTINSYMYGNARAIAQIAALKGDSTTKSLYNAKADTLKTLITSKLWNPENNFFETVKKGGAGEFAGVREAIGYIPWYFNLADEKHDVAWQQVIDPKGFRAPFGLTTAERRHPGFRTHGCCKCEWDGAVWPFATSQTLTGIANRMNADKAKPLTDTTYFRLMELYVESQYYRGKPYIGEYLDETTGYWLKGDQERSRYYNHSTFNDLIISGLVGLRPREDDMIEVNPLIPQEKWDWFCLDNVLYHGKILTIIWDKNGDHYKKGKGLQVLVNGKKAGSSENIERLLIK
ncbi:MGH1-like glycoside hydrolase domain-containing protein [Dyadobacter chenhuakuii]|uniref:Glycoside hydrolase n=1 Tax=Dyadobacter chenhuakuii TaxID=2909339 RepID=A0ABY4XNW9_9BACT|nr:glycosyl hydrolase family 65 protein [Dyadobacter chenhuakuii]MCF2494713.1 glycoside hydrolase [Dyadobacter chenhuakuii]USJ31966.1 glycoside hydrolase [Dyadobacter chenhuakuii]